MAEPIELRQHAEALASEISQLPLEGQKQVMAALAVFHGQAENTLSELIEALLLKTRRYDKIVKYIEKRLEKNYALTPKRLAEECVYRFRINSKMMPLLISLGRKAKGRLHHRKSYAEKNLARRRS